MRLRLPSWGLLDLLFWTLAFLICAAITLGGASRENDLHEVVIRASGVPVFCLALWGLWRRPPSGPVAWGVGLALLVLAVPLLQLVPLPPAWWAALPGREVAEAARRQAGAPAQWMPLSLTPALTWACFLALIPPVGAFLAVLQLSDGQRRSLSGLVLVLAGLSALLGALQIVSGFDMLLRPYPTVHEHLPIGFFANRNHQASLMACAVALTAVWIAELGRLGGLREKRFQVFAAVVMLALFIVAAALTRSRAGILVTLLAVAGGVALNIRSGGFGRRNAATWAVLGASTFALLGLAQFGMQALLKRFDHLKIREGRLEFWPDVLRAGSPYQPLGSGMGSFDDVYRSSERLDAMTQTFLNHAHNDYLEIWLEGGWPAVGLLAVILTGLCWLAVRAWLAPTTTASNLARGGSIVCLVLLLHSGVDYPMRTSALSLCLALSAAFVWGGLKGKAARA